MGLKDVLCWRPSSLPVRSSLASLPSLTQTHITVIVLVIVLSIPPQVDGFGVCRSSFRCLNGGEERYGQSIFGPCRCRCRRGYTGPRCQYREVTRKRSNALNVLNDFVQARLRAERQQLLEQEEAFVSADHDPLPSVHTRRRRRGRATLLSLLSHR